MTIRLLIPYPSKPHICSAHNFPQFQSRHYNRVLLVLFYDKTSYREARLTTRPVWPQFGLECRPTGRHLSAPSRPFANQILDLHWSGEGCLNPSEKAGTFCVLHGNLSLVYAYLCEFISYNSVFFYIVDYQLGTLNSGYYCLLGSLTGYHMICGNTIKKQYLNFFACQRFNSELLLRFYFCRLIWLQNNRNKVPFHIIMNLSTT